MTVEAPRRAAALAACAVLAAACASALRSPRPVEALAPPAVGRPAPALLRDADAAWARRAEPGQAAAAQELYLQAAAADPTAAPPLVGALRAMTFRVEHEPAGEARARLAEAQVEVGQRCQQVAPAEPACDYRLALALGQQARERPATGLDALKRMVELLRRTAATAPRLDEGGPHRVLALVLLRAPGWPLGPGDPEAALAEAREAARLFPDAAGNQLALGEALEKNGDPRGAAGAYRRALALADAAAPGDLDAPGWRRDARAGLARVGAG